jgi:hypothetical protein
MYVASGVICADAVRHPRNMDAMIMMFLFILLVFFVCYQSFGRNEPFDSLDVSEESEGDDADYSIARNCDDHSKRTSDMSYYQEDDEYLERF